MKKGEEEQAAARLWRSNSTKSSGSSSNNKYILEKRPASNPNSPQFSIRGMEKYKQLKHGKSSLPLPKGKENVQVKNSKIAKPVYRPPKSSSGSCESLSVNQGEQPSGHLPTAVATTVNSSSCQGSNEINSSSSQASTVKNSPADRTVRLQQSVKESCPVSPDELTTRLFSISLPCGIDSPQLKASPVRHSPSTAPALVPGLNDLIRAKIKSNSKRASSLRNTPNNSPRKVPALREFENVGEGHVYMGQGESDSSVGSVSNSRPGSSCSDRADSPETQQLEHHFRQLFKAVDVYRAGMVSANELLAHLLSYVDLPQLNGWKIDQLRRLLDPDFDNCKVGEAHFLEVGRKWAELLLDPDNYSVNDVGHQDVFLCQSNQSDPCNASFGSVEGLGGLPGCDSKEVELENRVSELRYQLFRSQEENCVLQKALGSAEDVMAALNTELDTARSKISLLSEGLERVNTSVTAELEAAVAGRKAEDECCNVAARMEQLRTATKHQEVKLAEQEQMCEELREREAAAVRREAAAVGELAIKVREAERLVEEVAEREVQRENEERVRREMEERVETLEQTVGRLEAELTTREEEIRNLSCMKGSSQDSGAINGSYVNDVSVDDRVLEDLSHTNSNSPTPKKVLPVTPLKRGPSASSTPARMRIGSIGDELKELGLNSSLPSPLCEKGRVQENSIQISARLNAEIGKWEEGVRRAIIEADPSQSGRLVSAVNRVMEAARADILARMDTHQGESLQEANNRLRNELEEVKRELGEARETVEREREEGRRERDKLGELEMVEARLTEMATLLQAANKALIAAGQCASRENSRPTTPVEVQEASLDEDLLSNWQLDLDGIELVEWNNNLSKRLLQYSKLLREDISRADDERDGHQRLWLTSLFTKLEELHTQTEKSRDLLMLAGDSFREEPGAVNSSIRFPKTQACQTEQVLVESLSCATESVEKGEDALETLGTGAKGGGRGRVIWSWLLNLVGVFLIVITLFTFVCGLEWEGRVFYPITYSPTRFLECLPKPSISLRYTRPRTLVW